MEYILFTVGAVLILVSLFLTYRVDRNQDSYYIESELLSEIREVKKDMEEDLGAKNFQQFLDKEVGNQNFVKEIRSLKGIIKSLEGKIDKANGKLDKLEEHLTNHINDSFSQQNSGEASSQERKFKPKEYEKIKKLVEEGLSFSEIARELEMGSREVDLIWKLNNSRRED